MPIKILFPACLLLWSTITLLAQNVVSRPLTSAVDIRHYNINLQFDWGKKKAMAEVTISLEFTQATRSIQLAAHDLWIHAVHTAAKGARLRILLPIV
ncbi:MAG: hypothetical protein IPO07_18315 [Haliscomenobacter sp.]|nr:hypothetical protein [Haliscomenobacter sp.]MBK9490511.1 hypothetical protein [Haliscomenobacter sp.]